MRCLDHGAKPIDVISYFFQAVQDFALGFLYLLAGRAVFNQIFVRRYGDAEGPEQAASFIGWHGLYPPGKTTEISSSRNFLSVTKPLLSNPLAW